MDLRQLEILQAIAETGSFTACGRKLHVSQSAISRQILLLEEELGEPLFLRVGRQVRMTPAAESLVQLGQRVFLDVRETVGAITDRTRELRGTLRLSGGMTVCLYVFPPLLKHLRRVHPHLDVRLTVATAGRSVQEIRGGRVDAGLLTLPVAGVRPGDRPGPARGTAAGDDADASAGATTESGAARTSTVSRSCCSRSGRPRGR